MKFSMDETMKHRVIGITVIISIAAVFLPAMLKKNSQRMNAREITVQLPLKPEQAKLKLIEEEQAFVPMKVAHVELPSADTQRADAEYEDTVHIGKPKPPHTVESIRKKDMPKENSSKPKMTTSHLQTKRPKPQSVPLKKPIPKTTTTSSYTVQMGVFSREENAQSLLKVLQSKGFSVKQSVAHEGTKKIYKVMVGNSRDKAQAEKLKQALWSQTHIKGFVVEKEVV